MFLCVALVSSLKQLDMCCCGIGDWALSRLKIYFKLSCQNWWHLFFFEELYSCKILALFWISTEINTRWFLPICSSLDGKVTQYLCSCKLSPDIGKITEKNHLFLFCVYLEWASVVYWWGWKEWSMRSIVKVSLGRYLRDWNHPCPLFVYQWKDHHLP